MLYWRHEMEFTSTLEVILSSTILFSCVMLIEVV